jgi:hypothetical protein
VRFWLRAGDHRRSLSTDVVLPALGFLFCFGIWWGLASPARIVGGIWFAVGLGQLAWHTRGFRRPPATIDLGEE